MCTSLKVIRNSVTSRQGFEVIMGLYLVIKEDINCIHDVLFP